MTPPIERPECHEALDWLQRKLDGSTPSMSESVSAHISICADCRGRIGVADQLLAILADKPRMRRLPSERIVLAVQRDQRRQLTARWVTATAALAAALVLTVWLATRPTTGPQLPPMANAPSLREGAGEAADAVIAIGKRTAVETIGESRMFVPKVELPSVAVTALASAATPFSDAGKGLIDGLEPVAMSAKRAVSMFLKDSGERDVKKN